MNFYQTLGVSETATADEIKQAYRRLAAKHHPDKGGDTSKFQEISAAYDTLSDPDKKAKYDAQRHASQNPNFDDGFGFINDIFEFHFGRGGFHGFRANPRSANKNRDLTIQTSISLKQSYVGAKLEAQFKLPSGKDQTVLVDIMPGIQDNQVIRYQGLGDDSIPNLPRGNLNVAIHVMPDNNYARRGTDLYTKISLNIVEAAIGCKKEIKIIDDTREDIIIPPGTRHGAMFLIQNKGFRNLNSGKNGNCIVEVDIDIPKITNESLATKLKELYNEYTNLSK